MKAEIRNCTVQFKCPKFWRQLTPTEDPKVRWCDQCSDEVHLVETEEELAEQAALGRCVAILNLSREHPEYSGEELLGDIVPEA